METKEDRQGVKTLRLVADWIMKNAGKKVQIKYSKTAFVMTVIKLK